MSLISWEKNLHLLLLFNYSVITVILPYIQVVLAAENPGIEINTQLKKLLSENCK